MSNKLNTHLTQNGIITGGNSPKGIVTPQYVGQIYVDEITGEIYIAYGLHANFWNRLQTGKSLIMTLPSYKDLELLPIQSLESGTKCFVEETGTYYKFLNNKWRIDTSYLHQEEEPTDTSVIWFTPSGTVVNDTKSHITIEELMANISVLVTKIKGLEGRVAYLEKHGGSNTPVETDIILLENGDPITLENGDSLKLEDGR